MSSQAALLTNIKQTVFIDLKSDKVNVRTHSLENIHNIFDNRSEQLCAILRLTNNNHSDDDSFSWSELFDGLHEAIKDQCMRIDAGKRSQSQKSLISKNDSYKEALRKCINLANNHIPNVSYTKICHAAFECFEIPAISPYFDVLYLQIVLKHILNAKHSTSELKVTDWSRLLSYVFRAYEQESCQIPKLDLLQCIPLILRHGTKNTYLVSDLHQYLPDIIQMLNSCDKRINAQKQILHIVYEFIRNLSVNQRLSVVRFTELILEKLLSLYQSGMDDDSKVVLLKIMHIAIVIHSPEPKIVDETYDVPTTVNDELFKKSIAENVQLWHKHLRNMFGVIEREIKDLRKRSTRMNPNPAICHTFVQVAAKLCSVIFWNPSVWNSGSDEQQQKRRCHSMKLEKMLELVEYEPQKFCWRWFAILSELMAGYPHVLQADDYQPVLKLISDFKPSIQHSLPMKCFIRIAGVMLSKGKQLKINTNPVVASFCTTHWHKIMELSFKQAATDKTQLENLDLLRVMIENGVIVSFEFIKKMINEVTEMSHIKKSNSSIKLLISILRNVNTDMIDGIKNLKIAIIMWLRPQVKLMNMKNILANNNTFDRHLISELYVLCVLSRQSLALNKNSLPQIEADQDENDEHDLVVADLVRHLQYRMMCRLIVSDALQVKETQPSILIEKLPQRNETKTSLDEALFTELEKTIHDDIDRLPGQSDRDENSIDNLGNISRSLATNVNILNSLIGHESIDADAFCKFLTKRVFLKIGQLNTIVGNFDSSINIQRNPNDVNEVIENLLTVWHDNYHPIIAENIFIVKNSWSIIEWLKAQMNPSRQPASVVLSPLKSANELEFQECIQLKCLTLLAHFSAFEDENDDEFEVFTAIADYKFKYKRNQDLYILFQLIKIILNQRCPPEQSVDWAFTELQKICQQLSSHQDYMELVADNIPSLVKCVKPHESMHDDLITLLSSFLKQINKKKYGQRINVKIINSVQYFVQEFFALEDCTEIIQGHVKLLNKFLKSEYLNIQFATVACLTNVFNKLWLNYDENKMSCVKIQEIHSKLADELQLQDLSVEQENDVDRKVCIVSTRLQSYCSIIGSCFPLRKQMWFNLIEFCCQHLKLGEKKSKEIVRKLSLDVFQKEPSDLLCDLFPFLLSSWIDNDYLLLLFPSNLTHCNTHDDFIIEYLDVITIRILEYKSKSMVDQLVAMVQARSLADVLTTPILVKCLARLTSVNVCSESAKECKLRAVNMLKTLRSDIPHIENYFDSHPLEIIAELLSHMWDMHTFRNYFGTDVEFVVNEHTINYDIFKKSLVYIQEKALRPTNIVQHFCDVSPAKILNILYSLKLLFQKSVCEEDKLSKLLQICTLIDIIVVDFLMKNANNEAQWNTVEFFIRDFVYFFGNTINSKCSDKTKFATCKFFHRMCEKILPECAKHFQPHLNYVVSVLTPITKSKPQSNIFEAGMSFLRFLIIGQTSALKEAIGLLDSFPMQPDFEDLRTIQNNVKYNGKSFSLLEEIEYFLSVEKRKVEGLLSLKEHLSEKKNELKEIYKTIYDSRGFSEDCEKSPIHRLISALLTHIVQNVDSERSLVAAKCLGELGPSDLGSTALKFDVQLQTYKICKSFKAACSNLCEHLLEKLNGIFIHGDTTVLQAAADACQKLLQSQMAVDLLDKTPFLRIFETGVVADMPLKPNDNQSNLAELFEDEAFQWKHSYWVKKLAIELFTLFDGESFAQVAAMQTPFSTAMIPLLVKVLLSIKQSNHRATLNAGIDCFFSKTSTTLTAERMEVDSCETSSKTPVYLDKVSIRLMLNIAECIRTHNQNCNPSERLKLNYLHIARAALFCEAYFTAILYGELASYECNDGQTSAEIKSIMKGAYQSIGETDAVSAFLNPIQQEAEYLEMKHCWNELLIRVDAQSSDLPAYANILGQAGLYNFANKLTQNSNFANYESAWRLADWSIVEGNAENTAIENDEFEKYHYFALKSLDKTHMDRIRVKSNVKKAFEAIINRFKQSSYECTKNIYKNLKMLYLLQEIEEFCHIQFRDTENERCKPEFIINKWKCQDEIASCEFSHREMILAQRFTLFQSATIVATRKIENLNDGIQQILLKLVTECREEGDTNLGKRYSYILHKMKLPNEIEAKAFIEDAQLHWIDGKTEMAHSFVKAVIDKKTPSFVHSTALSMMGEYLAEAGMEDTNTVIQNYLMEAMVFSSKLKQKADRLTAGKAYHQPLEVRERLDLLNRKRNYRAIAKYADREYQQTAAYRKSTEFERKQKSLIRRQAIMNEMKNRNLTQDEKRSCMIMNKTLGIDKSDVETTNTTYACYLHSAVENYMQSVLLEDSNESSSIFRLFGLWFSNTSDQTVMQEIKDHYTNIPSYKFLALMPQITAHLSTEVIKDLIEKIVLKCAVDHPHHVLPKLLALVNAFKDEEILYDMIRSSSPRTDAATKLIQKLKENRNLQATIVQMERMYEVLIKLANVEMKKAGDFPAQEPIRKLRDLNAVHCPTVKLPTSISGDYSQTMVGIKGWKSSFSLVGGINAPKKITCIGSNGQQYSQLLKGKDDLRQDAVMQQVFNIMNDMLGQSKVTKKDRLNVRTYIITPLSQRSGILEWCENTMPLTEYLVGSSSCKGAHERFHPKDWTPKYCRDELSKTPLRATAEKDILKNFNNICEHIKPVFHHFFFEHFHNPGVWFERRMAYAHSLATTSMIGYILGIGDRHVSNILIDNTTAELIHIDFGIAFEQGKCLPTPELIPFRLTRDLVSALGPSGVEGVYRKSCEKTMEVLRQNKSTILTIVEVLLHDPLYAWTLTSDQASRRQQTDIEINSDEEDKNTMAERALWRLEEKLDGKHVGRDKSCTVERHVDILIRDAINPKLLCKLFVGWQPYL